MVKTMEKENVVVRFLDTLFNKVIPKKFIVFVIACILVYQNKISGDIWGYIAMIYIGTNGLQKLTAFAPVKEPNEPLY